MKTITPTQPNPQYRDQFIRTSQRLTSEYRKMKRNTLTFLYNPPTSQARIQQLLQSSPDFTTLLSIFFKKAKDRSSFENKLIISFLLSKNLKSQFQDHLPSKFLIDSTFYKYLHHYISIHLLKKNDPVYLQGDKSELIHLILYGTVNTFSFEKSTDVLTAVEYYEYLDDFMNKYPKDTFLLMKIIECNNDIYPVYSISDIPNYKEILKQCKYRLYKEERHNEYIEDDLINDIDEDSMSFSLKADNEKNESEIEKDNYYYTRLKEYLRNEGKQLITKMIFKKEYSYTVDNYFGNDNIIANIHTLTAKCISDFTVVITINHRSFITLVKNDYNAYIEREREYLYSSFIFNIMHRSKFIKQVFDSCNEMEMSKYEILLKQNEHLSKLYFTRNGTVQLYLDKTSVNELKDLITLLKSLLPKKILAEISVNENYNMDHSYKTIEKSMEAKRKFLIVNTEKSMFGECELFYPQLKALSLFNIKVVSENAKFYTFDYEKYSALLTDFPKLNDELHKASQLKIKTLLERLISICNNYHRKINEEYNMKLKEEKNLYINTSFQMYNGTKHNQTSSLLKSRMNNLAKFVLKRNGNYYESYDVDLYTELCEKNKNNLTLTKYCNIKENTSTNYNTQEISCSSENKQEGDKEGEKFIVTKRDIEKYKSPNLCLPVIEDMKIKYDYVRKAFGRKGGNLEKKGNIRLQNVPLINRMRKKENGKNEGKKKEGNGKLDFTIVAPKYKKEHDFKNIISSFPGGYYMAVHQFIDEKKKKFFEK